MNARAVPSAWLVMAGGPLAFVASFLRNYSVTITCSGDADACGMVPPGSVAASSAWGAEIGGMLLWGGAVLLLLAAVVVANRVFTDRPPHASALALAAAGFGAVLVGLFVNPSGTKMDVAQGQLQQAQQALHDAGVDVALSIQWNREIGYWLLLALALISLVGALQLVLGRRRPTPTPSSA